MNRFIQIILLIALLPTSVACDDDKHTLAEVNGKPITQEQFDAYLQLKHIPAEDKDQREAALKEFLQREGLAEVIAKEGKLKDATIEAEVNEFRKEMILSRYFEKFLGDQVSEESVQNAYGSDAAQYETRKVHAAHILLRTNKRMSEEQRSAKLTSAQELHSKIQSGESFEELAKEYSEDKISGARGGDLGWIKEGTINERFSKRAFELKAGTVTEPFETPFGFHLLKVIEEPKTIRRPLGAVAGEIRYKLRNEVKEKELKRLEAAVKITTKKKYNEKLTPKKANVTKPAQGKEVGLEPGPDTSTTPHLAPPQSATATGDARAPKDSDVPPDEEKPRVDAPAPVTKKSAGSPAPSASPTPKPSVTLPAPKPSPASPTPKAPPAPGAPVAPAAP